MPGYSYEDKEETARWEAGKRMEEPADITSIEMEKVTENRLVGVRREPLKIPPYPFAGSSLDRECPHGWAVWSCHDCNYGQTPEPPPDMSGFKMTTIREGAPPKPAPAADISDYKMETIRDPGPAGPMIAFAVLVVVVLILVLVMS